MYKEDLYGVNICFSTQTGLVSWIIRKATGAPASHSMITFRSATFEKTMVLEVQGRGFVMVPWSRWNKKNDLVCRYQLELPEEDLREALIKLADRLGDPYDTWSLIGFFFMVFGGLKRNMTDSKDKLVCSELVAIFLEWAGIDFEDIGRVTPRDLLNVAESHPEVFILKWSRDGFKEIAERAARKKQRLVVKKIKCLVEDAEPAAEAASASASTGSAE